MEKAARFGVSMPAGLLRAFDGAIRQKGYANRSEALSDLVRDFLSMQKWEGSDAEVCGALVLIYDHEKRGLSDKLVDLQHEEHRHILSTMHIHLDERSCMEMMAMRGKANEVKRISDRLMVIKGVKQGKLIMTSA